jgi:hypothetical protein
MTTVVDCHQGHRWYPIAPKVLYSFLKWSGMATYALHRQAKVRESGPGAFHGEEVYMANLMSASEKVCHGSSGLAGVVSVGGSLGGVGKRIWKAVTLESKSAHTWGLPFTSTCSSGVSWAFRGFV